MNTQGFYDKSKIQTGITTRELREAIIAEMKRHKESYMQGHELSYGEGWGYCTWWCTLNLEFPACVPMKQQTMKVRPELERQEGEGIVARHNRITSNNPFWVLRGVDAHEPHQGGGV